METPEVETNAPEQKTPEQKQQLVTNLGNLLHEEWRAPRKKEDGSFEPRIKVLMQHSDGKQKWYNESDSKIPPDAQEIERQDIANTKFEDLHANWQADNRVAAEVAMGTVFEAVESGLSLSDPAFLEEASAIVHEYWLKRNGWQATEIQKQPYTQLPKEEKEKDRVQVRKAIEIFESSK